MKTIYKYTLELNDRQEIVMPALAEILCVQMQDGKAHLWAEVESNATKYTRIIGIFGTGNPIPSNPKAYIGTIQIPLHGLVFHVYEILTFLP